MSKKKKTASSTNQAIKTVAPKAIKSPLLLNKNILWITLGVVLFLFCFSVIKNIQYPLFWADESMTVIGAERVLNYGYPKVHDGKNVFYDLRHSDPKLGIDEKTDAYIGGTSWGHYYYGAIGVKIAEAFSDIYIKTGIIRFTFAFLGILGLLLFVYITSALFLKIEHRVLFAIIFFFLTLFSVSTSLLLREARYYSLSIFLFSLISALYIRFRFIKPINAIAFRLVLIALLWSLYMTFAPAFFIVLVIITLSEVCVALIDFFHAKSFIHIIIEIEPVFTSLVIGSLLVYPFIGYFKTFEISEAMAVFNGYGKKMYWENVSTVLKYFQNFELFYLAVVLKIFLLLNLKSVSKFNLNIVRISLYSLLTFVVYLYLIARVPNFIYTRYIILLQPIIVFSICIDSLGLLISNGNGDIVLDFKSILVALIVIVMLGINISGNSKTLKGHLTELFNQYKGPLDYTIPAIQARYVKTYTLTIATNYEETSYMYYLNAKVIVGFTGNNLEEDSKLAPNVLAYRKPWGNYIDIFQGFMKKAPYINKTFEIYDNPVNNIPELNFMPAFNHKFETMPGTSGQDRVELYFKK